MISILNKIDKIYQKKIILKPKKNLYVYMNFDDPYVYNNIKNYIYLIFPFIIFKTFKGHRINILIYNKELDKDELAKKLNSTKLDSENLLKFNIVETENTNLTIQKNENENVIYIEYTDDIELKYINYFIELKIKEIYNIHILCKINIINNAMPLLFYKYLEKIKLFFGQNNVQEIPSKFSTQYNNIIKIIEMHDILYRKNININITEEKILNILLYEKPDSENKFVADNQIFIQYNPDNEYNPDNYYMLEKKIKTYLKHNNNKLIYYVIDSYDESYFINKIIQNISKFIFINWQTNNNSDYLINILYNSEGKIIYTQHPKNLVIYIISSNQKCSITTSYPNNYSKTYDCNAENINNFLSIKINEIIDEFINICKNTNQTIYYIEFVNVEIIEDIVNKISKKNKNKNLTLIKSCDKNLVYNYSDNLFVISDDINYLNNLIIDIHHNTENFLMIFLKDDYSTSTSTNPQIITFNYKNKSQTNTNDLIDKIIKQFEQFYEFY